MQYVICHMWWNVIRRQCNDSSYQLKPLLLHTWSLVLLLSGKSKVQSRAVTRRLMQIIYSLLWMSIKYIMSLSCIPKLSALCNVKSWMSRLIKCVHVNMNRFCTFVVRSGRLLDGYNQCYTSISKQTILIIDPLHKLQVMTYLLNSQPTNTFLQSHTSN